MPEKPAGPYVKLGAARDVYSTSLESATRLAAEVVDAAPKELKTK